MNEFNGSWAGQMRYRSTETSFQINMRYENRHLTFSLPDKLQFYILIHEFSYQSRSLTFSLFNHPDHGRIFLHFHSVEQLWGVLGQSGFPPVEFILTHQGECQDGIASYQPWPKYYRLYALLCSSVPPDFSPTRSIEYPYTEAHVLLKILYEKYHVIALLGSGNALEKAARLMRWVYKLVPQNGGVIALPPQRHGLILLENVLQRGTSLNCKGISVLFTDLLLSAGIRARLVHGLPHDENDPESHYLTEFFDTEMQKWVALDVAFGRFYRSEGCVLNVEEIRECLVDGKCIEMFTTDRKKTIADMNKIFYGMTKNFYRFEYYQSYAPGYANEYSQVVKIKIYPRLDCEKRAVL